MDESTKVVSPFDLFEIHIGNESNSARPIAWDREMADGEGRDAKGEFAIPIEYETVCPHCGQMVHFKAGLNALKCPECGKGEDVGVPITEIHPFQDPGEYIPIEIKSIPQSTFDIAAILRNTATNEIKATEDAKFMQAVKDAIRATNDMKLDINELLGEDVP